MALSKSLMGGEINQYKKLLNEGRNDNVQTLIKNAELLGANAVLGVRFGSTQILPATLDLFAYGTAVVVEPDYPSPGAPRYSNPVQGKGKRK
jgi:uncharacterized protein YbjQ (UPF0145 family)